MEWLEDTSWPKPAPAEFHLKLVAAAAAGLGDPVRLVDAQRHALLGRAGRCAAGRVGGAGRLGRRALARGRGAEAAGGPALARGLRALLERNEGTMMNANESLSQRGAGPAHARAGEGIRPGSGPRARARRGRAGCAAGRDAGRDGAERLRKVDAAAPAGRPGAPFGRRGVAGGAPHRPAEREGAGSAAPPRDRLRLPGLPPDGRAHRRGERRAARAAGRALAARGTTPGRRSCWSRSGSQTGPSICPRRSRAANASGSRSPARSATSRSSSSPTNRPATSTAPQPWTCSGSSTACARPGRRCSSSPTTPGSRPPPTG